MKKKSLNVKRIIPKNFLLDKLKISKIRNIYKEFEKNLINNSKVNRVAVAVSGGPDSLSLCYFTKCFSLKHNVQIFFYIVDHKLRKESTAEAKKVKSILKILKAPCKILTWIGKKPKTNLQSLARKKRYTLLEKQCKRDKVTTILFAHHIDDLYENFFIRLSRGSGLRGLLSFYAISNELNENVNIVRPLIFQNKKDLTFTTKKIFNFFVKDPTNNDDFYQRTRLRKLIKSMKEEGFDENKLRLTLNNLRESNVSINYYVRKNIDLNSKFFSNKSAYILSKSFFDQPKEIVFRSFTQILKIIGLKYYSPRGKSLSLLIDKINGKFFYKATLSGCIIEKISNSIKISRENTKKV
tara:strand:+ start:518 stop:1576 length:1059 start_codon:yes stop_codon:yes gene_type:complete